MEMEYYSQARHEILPFLPRGEGLRVLDVGCGAGVTGALVKRTLPSAHVTGVELFSDAAAKARQVIDEAHVLDLDRADALPFPTRTFDLILCLDVLEHLVDPWAWLKKLRSHLSEDGTILVSLPNTRHLKVVAPLLFRGQWRYEDNGGLLDKTHLRFFTKESGIALVKSAGLEISSVSHTGMGPGSKTWWMNLFTLGLLKNFLVAGYLIQARQPRIGR